MRFIRALILAVTAGALVMSFGASNFSKPIDSKKTNRSCVFCHTKYGSKELTEAGKYYRDKGTLDGYKEK